MLHRIAHILCAALFLLGTVSGVFAQTAKVPRGAPIYIEEMDSDLDGFIRAEFVKQNVPLKVVLKREEALIVMLGTSAGNEKRSWHEGWLTTEKDHAVGNITVISRVNGEMLWAGEAGDRSLWWGGLARGGQRKVAARLIDNLKKSIAPQAGPLPAPPPLSADELIGMMKNRADTTQTTNLSSGAPAKTKPLTNDDIVKMLEAGFGEDLIVNRIKASDTDFNLDTDAMIALKKAGVTEKVLAAMMEKQKT